MKTLVPHLNLVLAWLWLVLGFISGLLLGMNFHREDWLGGYNSFKRRLYRLGHISFFGLGAVNFFFYFTCVTSPTTAPESRHDTAFLLRRDFGWSSAKQSVGHVPGAAMRSEETRHREPSITQSPGPHALRPVCAAWALILGALTMPACCVLTAHWKQLRLLFAVPVLSLITGGILTLLEIIKL